MTGSENTDKVPAEPRAQIHELIKGYDGSERDSGRVIRELETIFDQLIDGKESDDLRKAIGELSYALGATRNHADRIVCPIYERLLSSYGQRVRREVVRSLFYKIRLSVHFTDLMMRYDSLVALEEAILNPRLAFLSEIVSTCSEEDISYIDWRDLQVVFPNLFDLLMARAEATAIASVVRMSMRVRDPSQCHAISRIRESFERGDMAMKQCIAEGMALAIPTRSVGFKSNAVKCLNAWTQRLSQSKSEVSAALGETLMRLSRGSLEEEDG